MKFMLLLTVVTLIPGYQPRVTGAGYTWPTRAACVDIVGSTDAKLRTTSHGRMYIEQFDCIQIDGPVPKFPVREKIATGRERA